MRCYFFYLMIVLKCALAVDLKLVLLCFDDEVKSFEKLNFGQEIT